MNDRSPVPRILVVEDDDSLGQSVVERLRREQFAPTWARSITSARQELGQEPWDLAILDVRLPDGNGFDLARDIRRASDVPIMFMTALDSVENRLEGSEVPASTYLPKPFHFKELLIRVRLAIQPRQRSQVIRDDDLEIDLTALYVQTVDGDRVFLQTRDARVLAELVQAAPAVVTRSHILDAAWGADRFPTSRGVDNAIVRLRQAIGPRGTSLIRSVRGEGYQWTGKKSQ